MMKEYIMENSLLIRRLKPNIDLEELRTLSLVLGSMNEEAVVNSVIETLADLDYIDNSKVMLKYEGIDVLISYENLPNLILKLLESNVKVYGVYESIL